MKFDEKGLIPAIAQDYKTGEVLMQAYMNEESLRLTKRNKKGYILQQKPAENMGKGVKKAVTSSMLKIFWLTGDEDCILS